ncbi:monovalent cation/H+ antiporter subunit D family protein [Haloferacaceae archaeon DSL9]
MSDVLLPIMIAVPIVTAIVPLLAGARWENVGWPVAFASALVTFGLSLAVAASVYPLLGGTGRLIHELGDFPRPIGIELVGDELSALLSVLVTGVAVAVLVYSRRAGPHGNAFYSGYLLLTGGLLGVTFTGDLFNLFVFLEITGLVTYALVASDRSGKAAYAALKYLFIGTVGASLYLIGVGYAFVATGTLNMIDMRAQLVEVGYTDPLVQAAFGFILAGFAIKVALFPLHTWQPDAYSKAPDSVSAYISALVSTVAAYALIRVSYDVFTVSFFEANPDIATAVVALASVSIVVGSLLAALQSEVKRMFAYSSVAQFGMIVAAIGLTSETALLGALIHLVGHGLMKAALFMSAGILAAGYGARTVSDYAGLANRAPFTAGAVAIVGFALVGIPPSVGFIGKWFIALGAVQEGAWGVAAVIFVSTLLTLLYVARLIEQLYFSPAKEPHERHGAAEGRGAVADGGTDESLEKPQDRPSQTAVATDGVSVGMVAVVIALTAVVVALFFSADLFAELLDPVLGRFFA